MTAVDSLLNDTADYLQSAVRNNPELADDLRRLLLADHKPQVVRELRGVIPGAQCLIVLGDTLVG